MEEIKNIPYNGQEPKRKRPRLNGYALFAQAYAQSNNLNMPFNALIEYVSPHWDELDDEKKKSYKDQASFINSGVTVEIVSLSNSVLEVKTKPPSPNQAKAEAAERKLQLQTMIEEVRVLVQKEFDAKRLHTAEFYIMSGSTFCATEDDVFPAEFAISKFSLQEGISKNFHVSINPGPLPPFTAHEAQKRSIASFKYPVPSDKDTCDDYIGILQNLLNFMKPSNYFPDVYFVEGEFDGNLHEDYDDFVNNGRILKKLLEEAGEYQIASETKFYPVNFLLYFLKLFTAKEKDEGEDEDFESLHHAYVTMQRDKIEFECFVKSCDYHDDTDASMHCCLTKTQCYAYILAKYCADSSLYELQDGRHYPSGCKIVS